MVNGKPHSRYRHLIPRWAAGRKEPFVAPALAGLVDSVDTITAHQTAFEMAIAAVNRVNKAGKRLKDIKLPDVSALAGEIVYEAWQATTTPERPPTTSDVDIMRKAIRARGDDGKTTKPAKLIEDAHIANKRGRVALRELQSLGEYNGFARPRSHRRK